MNWTDAEVIGKAGAEGRLRCEECGIPVAFANPLEPGRMVWLECERWVENGEPKARCTTHNHAPC